MGKAKRRQDVTYRNGVNVAPIDGVPIAEEPITKKQVKDGPAPKPVADPPPEEPNPEPDPED